MPASIDTIRVRKRLFVVLIAYEIVAISVMILAGFSIATAHGGTAVMAAPLLLIAAAEMMRIPLSGWATRLPLAGRILTMLALLVIAIGSFEALSLALEQFVNARVANVMNAGHEVETAERAVQRIVAARSLVDGDVDKLTHEVAALDGQIVELNHTRPQAPTTTTPKICRDKHKRRAPCGVDPATGAAVRASDAQIALLKGIADQRQEAQRRLTEAHVRLAGVDSRDAEDRLSTARQRLADELLLSPMHRLAAAVFSTPAGEVSDQQFQTVKRIVVFGLAAAFALLSALVSTIVHLQAKRADGGKVKRAVRAWLARRRKPLVVHVPGPTKTQVEIREHTRIVYLPVDEQGRVLNPDAEVAGVRT